MDKKKVAKGNEQIKLSFSGMPEGEFDIEGLMASLRMEYQALTVSAGALVVQAIMKAECEQLAGKPYARKTDIDRWGSEDGYAVLGGQKVEVKRPRLRTKQKQEVHLTSYERFQDEGQRTQAVFSRLVAGVSNRHYASTVEEFGRGYGISKSVISRKVVEATSEQLRNLCERDLSKLDLCVLVIDGVQVNKRVLIVVLGVETSGKKHILGMRQGATENSQVCTELFKTWNDGAYKAIVRSWLCWTVRRHCVRRWIGSSVNEPLYNVVSCTSAAMCSIICRIGIRQSLTGKWHRHIR